MPGDAGNQDTGTVIIFGVASAELHAARIARLDLQPTQVVVIDPLLDPSAPPAHLMTGLEATEIIDCAIGSEKGEAMASVWSALGLVGLQEPTPALRALFPGLRCKHSLQVRTQSLATLAERLSHLPAPFTIWIDMPGAEAELLAGLAATDLWPRTQSVSVRSGVEVFFEGACKAETLIERMLAQGFALAGRDEQDPDFPDLIFDIDLRQKQITELEAGLQALEAELEAATQERAAAEAQAKTQQDDFNALREKAEWRYKRIQELEADVNAAQERAGQQEAALTEAVEALAERDNRLAALEAELEAAIQARAAAEDRAKSEMAERDNRLAALEAEREAATQERAALRSEQAFAIRLRTMLQLDLDNLRHRLETSETQRLRQETLLRKLTPKLEQATEHLKHLYLAEPAISSEIKDDGTSGSAHGARSAKPKRKPPVASRRQAENRSSE